MASVYSKDAFQDRVNYAARCFMRGTSGTRHFDACFEMWDGDVVVTALVRRADKNAKLHAAIARQWGGIFPQGWLETAARFSDAPTRELSILAKQERDTAAAASEARVKQWYATAD